MKNEELRKIRHQLSAVSNKDQELIEAKRSVQRLEQKVEDLTAMLSSKTDQERQLHQEKQQLRVSLDREAQVKRVGGLHVCFFVLLYSFLFLSLSASSMT